MTGCCASSPSAKNPLTSSPPTIPLEALFPCPILVGLLRIAVGRSLSGSIDLSSV